MTTKLHMLFGGPLGDRGPSTTFCELGAALDGDGVDVSYYANIDRRKAKFEKLLVKKGLPRALSRVPYRTTRKIAEARVDDALVKAITEATGPTVAYLWSDTPLSLVERLRRAGAVTVREKIACGRQVSRKMLEKAYADLGALEHFDAPYLTGMFVDREHDEFGEFDYFFSASPQVKNSLIYAGCAAEKIIESSYGFDPARFSNPNVLRQESALTYLFVGSVGVGKGAHTVLDAWAKAKISGKLVLVGAIEPLIADRYSHILGRADVQWLPFTNDIEQHYKTADVFVFPSFSEGGPQVTYEAGACGLPSIVTPMGAGAFVREGEEGLIVPAGNVSALADAMVRLADDSGERLRLASQALLRSKDFTWAKVAARRRQQIMGLADAV